jgi:hypothetical protein
MGCYDRGARTTVTLDPDVERMLRDAMRTRGVSFKQALNDAIRAGVREAQPRRSKRFVQRSFHLGAEQYFRWDKALAAAEAMEDEELSRRLPLRKRSRSSVFPRLVWRNPLD